MAEEAWLTFPEAVKIVRDRVGTSIGRAEALVLAARESKEVRPRQSPEPTYLIGDDGLMGFDQRLRAKDGRFSRDDFLDWLDRHEPRSAPVITAKAAAPKQGKRSRSLRDRAEHIVKILWPDSVPPQMELPNAGLIQMVCDWDKADYKKRGFKHVDDLKRDTILRAAGRKK